MKRSTTSTIEHEGATIYYSVSPCSWMYAGYGLQVEVSITPNAVGSQAVLARDRSAPATEMTPEQLDEAARALVLGWLATNGLGPLREAIEQHARAVAELDKLHQKEVAKAARRIARMKSQGYTHRIVAWIHPTHGDDYQIEAFAKAKPSAADIARLVRESTVKDDYRVEAL